MILQMPLKYWFLSEQPSVYFQQPFGAGNTLGTKINPDAHALYLMRYCCFNTS